MTTDPLTGSPHDPRQIPWRSVTFALGVIVLALIVASIMTQVNSNKQAILKGCILLDNAIKQGQGSAKGGQILVSEILVNADQHGRPQVRVKYADAVKGQKPLAPLNCKRLADHPDEIVAIPLPKPKATPPPKPPPKPPTATPTRTP